MLWPVECMENSAELAEERDGEVLDEESNQPYEADTTKAHLQILVRTILHR